MQYFLLYIFRANTPYNCDNSVLPFDCLRPNFLMNHAEKALQMLLCKNYCFRACMVSFSCISHIFIYLFDYGHNNLLIHQKI